MIAGHLFWLVHMQYTFRPHIYFSGANWALAQQQMAMWLKEMRMLMSDLWKMGSRRSEVIGLASMASTTSVISYSLEGICGPSNIAAEEV